MNSQSQSMIFLSTPKHLESVLSWDKTTTSSLVI